MRRMKGSPALEAMLAFASRRAGMPDDVHLSDGLVCTGGSAFAELIPGGRPALRGLTDGTARTFLTDVRRIERWPARKGRPECIVALGDGIRAVFPAIPLHARAVYRHQFGEPADVPDDALRTALLEAGLIYERRIGEYAWTGLGADDLER